MEIREHEPLASHTTFRIGGAARVYVEAETDDDVQTALALSRERGLPLRVLGAGSNLLVPDEGVDAVVLRLTGTRIAFADGADGETLLAADAGARWDDVVDAAAARGLWGVENLAGIPGTMGGAAVQNIGAYGAELSEVFAYADTVDARGTAARIAREDARFAYRRSVFKGDRGRIITRVALALRASATPKLSYADLARAQEAGTPLATPAEIAAAVRAIRAGKFPGPDSDGTAGSFWKNPTVPREAAERLLARYPGLPQYPQADGSVKISLAWLLDHVLNLKGHAVGAARLYEKQPLVIVASGDASSRDVDVLARDVAERVQDATGITLEREVETFGA